ncbi:MULTISPECIES: hypothetical protein [unclassified Undibacterium]|uniref:hypothetical protein n=1 Tax=unclassified Undibacterium TaxID=2630295 RepID=UPI002AC8F572|nr:MULTISPECIES: hypothetical protein [unclassified Undibacterium]MEB0141117.1 hypothetical protein [Undibacterium sp. CCC2.1]MEB0174134.1 hypothetical protein [Undibacterium sp. CCC1.1]MEB0177835.1 hypothetical protein [Undibacterium sp. CCC3.4]MEB0217028.1 hypothetical protein [Undibacterium sp. 5I2]WPX41987.1 hypothetical protein RHM61_11255 [Undibacterium sp. CCC3.4]
MEVLKQHALTMMDTALAILDSDAGSIAAETLKVYFNNDTERMKTEFKQKLKATRDFAKFSELKTHAVSVKGDDVTDANFAYTKKKAITPAFRRYIAARADLEKQPYSLAFLKTQEKHAAAAMKADPRLDIVFLGYRKAAFDETRFSKDFLAGVWIHEFSHAAIDTEDYAYGNFIDTPRGEGNPEPLFRLRDGTIGQSDRAISAADAAILLHYQHYQREHIAINNADSFANAVRAMYSAQGDEHQQAFYARTVKAELRRMGVSQEATPGC